MARSWPGSTMEALPVRLISTSTLQASRSSMDCRLAPAEMAPAYLRSQAMAWEGSRAMTSRARARSSPGTSGCSLALTAAGLTFGLGGGAAFLLQPLENISIKHAKTNHDRAMNQG